MEVRVGLEKERLDRERKMEEEERFVMAKQHSQQEARPPAPQHHHHTRLCSFCSAHSFGRKAKRHRSGTGHAIAAVRVSLLKFRAACSPRLQEEKWLNQFCPKRCIAAGARDARREA